MVFLKPTECLSQCGFFEIRHRDLTLSLRFALFCISVENQCGEDSSAVFPCVNGTECVLYLWAMDGDWDCADGSDEGTALVRCWLL